MKFIHMITKQPYCFFNIKYAMIGIEWAGLGNFFTHTNMASWPWVEGIKPYIKFMSTTSQFTSRVFNGCNMHVDFRAWVLLHWQISQDFTYLLIDLFISCHQNFTRALFQVLCTPTWLLYIVSWYSWRKKTSWLTLRRTHFKPLLLYHATRCNYQKQNAMDCASSRTKDQEHTLQLLHDTT